LNGKLPSEAVRDNLPLFFTSLFLIIQPTPFILAKAGKDKGGGLTKELKTRGKNKVLIVA